MALSARSILLPLSAPRKAPPLAPIFASTSTLPASGEAPEGDHKLVVSGGCRLSGHVHVSGSKNSALAVLAGTLCCSSGGPAVVRGLPDLSDTRTMAAVLRSVGATVEETGPGEVVVDASGVGSVEPAPEEVGRIRAGFFVLGPLMARFGEAEVALPGGCRIGARPIDLYVRGLSALGAVVELS